LPRESGRRCRISSTSCSENWCSTPPEVSLSLDGVSSLILPMVVFSAPPPRSQHRQDATNGWISRSRGLYPAYAFCNAAESICNWGRSSRNVAEFFATCPASETMQADVSAIVPPSKQFSRLLQQLWRSPPLRCSSQFLSASTGAHSS
jgi:hypothetical protein